VPFKTGHRIMLGAHIKFYIYEKYKISKNCTEIYVNSNEH
jgi:hypothetical protein